MEKAGNIVATLFISREQAHRAHLSTRSFAQHVALGEFYEEIIDLADKFAETAQCLYGILSIPYAKPVNGQITSVLEHHAATIEECRKFFNKPEECALLNIIDEVSGLYSRTIYKLAAFK